MYSTSQPVSTSANGMGSDILAGPGTINPAALNSAGRKILFSSDLVICPDQPGAWGYDDAQRSSGYPKPMDHVAMPSRALLA